MFLKQSTATTMTLGPFVDSTDGVTAKVALTIGQSNIQLSKNGGGFSQTSETSPSVSHDVDGWYSVPLTAADTDTIGVLKLQITMPGALPIWVDVNVVSAAVYDSLFGTESLTPNNADIVLTKTAAESTDTKLTITRAAKLDRDIAHAAAAETYKADVSGLSTFNPANDAVANVTLVDTTTTNTDMVAPAPTTTEIKAALLNEGDGQQLIDAIVTAIDDADIDTNLIATLVRDGILDRVLSGNHDAAGTVGKLLQDIFEDTDELQAADLSKLTVPDILNADYEDGETFQEFLRLVRASSVGEAAGANTETIVFKSKDKTTDRITAQVDEYGNRTNVTTDAS